MSSVSSLTTMNIKEVQQGNDAIPDLATSDDKKESKLPILPKIKTPTNSIDSRDSRISFDKSFSIPIRGEKEEVEVSVKCDGNKATITYPGRGELVLYRAKNYRSNPCGMIRYQYMKDRVRTLEFCNDVEDLEKSIAPVLDKAFGFDRGNMSNAMKAIACAFRINKPVDYPALVVPNTPELRRFIKLYQSTRRHSMERSLKRRHKYHDDMAGVFRKFGLPIELIEVALVESGFKARARSKMGAVGIWQLMPRTARSLGLKVSWRQDQRKDVLLSTHAVARYFAELYERYEDWSLVLAAYNVGPTCLSNVMRRAKSKNFSEIVRNGWLTTETIEFVPKVFAASLIAADPEKYGLLDRKSLYRILLDGFR